MSGREFYNEGSRELQEQFGSRGAADRMEAKTGDVFTPDFKAFVEESTMFFLATADAAGAPDSSYRGGVPGFVRVLDAHTLAFPDYDGNGMFRSLGNIKVNAQVGLLFIDFEAQRRLRVNGSATVHGDDPLLMEFPGAQLVIRLRAQQIFYNCPRYIHHMKRVELSKHAPDATEATEKE